MEAGLLTAKQLADTLGLSVKTIQRAYRRGHIPVEWLNRTAFFDLHEVRLAMKNNGKTRVASLNADQSGAAGGASRRRAVTTSPRSVKRGRNFQETPRRKA